MLCRQITNVGTTPILLSDKIGKKCFRRAVIKITSGGADQGEIRSIENVPGFPLETDGTPLELFNGATETIYIVAVANTVTFDLYIEGERERS